MAHAVCTKCGAKHYWKAGKGVRLVDLRSPCCEVEMRMLRHLGIQKEKQAPDPTATQLIRTICPTCGKIHQNRVAYGERAAGIPTPCCGARSIRLEWGRAGHFARVRILRDIETRRRGTDTAVTPESEHGVGGAAVVGSK